MKSFSILALAAGAAATGFQNANPFTCPQNTDNKCTDTQKSGYDFSDLPIGGFNQYKDFNWYGGWSCGSSAGKRFEPRTNGGKFIGATCGTDKSKSPSFGCGANIDKFSLGGMHVKPEFDCDLEFHYDMPDGSTCKQRSSCSKSGTDITNTQCGGAKNVTIVYPNQGKPQKSCSVDIHTITFDCNSATSTTVKTTSVKTTSTSVKTTTTPAVKTTSTSTSTPAEKTTSSAPVKETTSTTAAATTSSKPEEKTSSSTVAIESSTSSKPGNLTTTKTTKEETSTSSKPEVTTSSTTAPVQVTTTSSVVLTTSTIFTTSTQTITSCKAEVTNCPAESRSVVTTVVTVAVSTTVCPVTETATSSAVATTTTPSTPVETLPCPDVVPKCMNTFLFIAKCDSNTDSSCYCPSEIFIKSVFDCVWAHGESDEIVSESIIYIQGLCAPHVPENPAIATGATITSYVTVTATPPPSAVYTTVVVEATTVVPCTDSAGSVIPSSSSTSVLTTAITVPQVGFTTSGDSVGVVPVTSYTAVPTTSVAAVKTNATVPSSTGSARPTTSVVISNGAGRVGAGLSVILAVAGLVAAL